MEIFLISFVVLILAVSGMAIGILFGRQGIQGSCGGLNKVSGLNISCLLCRKRTCPGKSGRDPAKVN